MEPFSAAGLAAVGAGAFGGLYSTRMNEIEAGRNRDWQYNMSSTAHQREVRDLMAAGLNPVLSAGGSGASSGGGAQAHFDNPLKDASSAFLQNRLQEKQIDVMDAEERKKETEIGAIIASMPGIAADSTAKGLNAKAVEADLAKQQFLKYLYGKGMPMLNKLEPFINSLIGSIPNAPSTSASSVANHLKNHFSKGASDVLSVGKSGVNLLGNFKDWAGSKLEGFKKFGTYKLPDRSFKKGK